MYEIDIDLARMSDSMLDSCLRDLMKYYTIYFRRVDTESFTEMPSYRFSFTIFIGRYPYLLCFFCVALELGDTLLLLRGDLVLRNESCRDIDSYILGWEVSDMPE